MLWIDAASGDVANVSQGPSLCLHQSSRHRV